MKTEAITDALDVETLNLNISAYRVLYILLLLVQHQSLSLTGLNHFLYENPLIQRVYNNETITKYINTLRRAGCGIPRSSLRNDFHYTLAQSPFPLNLTEEEVSQLIRSATLMRMQAAAPRMLEYRAFLEKVAWSLPDAQQAERLLQAIRQEPGADEAAWVNIQERQALLRRYQGYCADSLMLSVDYPADETAQVTSLVIEPKRVAVEGQNLYLLGQDCRKQCRVKLNLDKIDSVRQLPAKNRTGQNRTTVVFQLYGRLARNYRPYPGEEVHALGEETLQVRAKTDDPQALVRRLLKYDRSCQVISPAGIREEMRTRIQRLIARMQDVESEA